MADYQTFTIDEFHLANGLVFPNLKLAYKTYGELAADGSNAVLFPTWFSSPLSANQWLIGEDKALDPRSLFIVCVALLGNGESSSPSNTPPPFNGPSFPEIDLIDNVRAQHILLSEHLGVKRLMLAIGRSMGAQNVFQWACQFPEMIDSLLAFSGSSKTTPHNYAFLAGVKAALIADQDFDDGHYSEAPERGLRAVGLAYAGWALSQEFYRQGLHLADGCQTIDEYLKTNWAGNFISRDANNLLTQIGTWQRGDVSTAAPFHGDWAKALSCMTMRSIVMPCRTDLYFPPEDSASAVAKMPNAELRVIDSVWGHRAGGPGGVVEDQRIVEKAISDLLGD